MNFEHRKDTYLILVQNYWFIPLSEKNTLWKGILNYLDNSAQNSLREKVSINSNPSYILVTGSPSSPGHVPYPQASVNSTGP